MRSGVIGIAAGPPKASLSLLEGSDEPVFRDS
jgi:hypothetical protein